MKSILELDPEKLPDWAKRNIHCPICGKKFPPEGGICWCPNEKPSEAAVSNIILPPYDSTATFEGRVAAVPEGASILGYFLRQGLWVMERELGREAASAMDAMLSKRVFIHFLSYPMHKFMPILGALSAKMGVDKAHAEVATAMLTPFFSSPVGAIMFTLARTTPHTLIEASVAGYRACVSWGTRTYERVGDREALMHYKDDLLGPAWHAVGIFPPAIAKACGVQAQVTVEDCDEARMNFTLRTRW